MKSVILSLAGGVLLSLAAEILLPDSEIKKASKFAIGIIIAMIVLNPLTAFLSKAKGLDYDFKSFTVSESYIEGVNDNKRQVYENSVEAYLENFDIEAVVKVELKDGEPFSAVIRVKAEHAEKAKKLTAEALKIETERITCYG